MPKYSRFSPNWSDPVELEAITVGRETEIANAVRSVRQSTLTKNKHHLLFIGPRGAGKTHLITLVYHRLSQMDDLTKKLRIAWLNEDETSDTLLSFLLRCHRALSKDYPTEFPAESTEQVYDHNDPDEALIAIQELLLNQLGKRTLLVLAENLDAIFRDFNDLEQKRWRALIQDNPQFCTVATAQKLFEDIGSQDAPFYGFFNITHLNPFDVNQAIELITKIAKEKGDEELAEFTVSPRGGARIRALHHLTGGNQRLFMILSEFINKQTLEELVEPFEELVDEQLTPYYQERLRWLSTQQRKIVEFLCATAKPETVKTISRHLFTTSQSISSQLKELKETGYLISKKAGRESYYELAEPLMRLSHQVKETRGKSPVRLIVDFLRIWYDRDQLEELISTCSESNKLTQQYFKHAIELWHKEGNLRLQFFNSDAEGIEPEGCDDEQLAVLKDLALESNFYSNRELYLIALLSKNSYFECINYTTELLAENSIDKIDRINFLLTRAISYTNLDQHIEAINDYLEIIDINDVRLNISKLAYFYLFLIACRSNNWELILDTIQQSFKIKGEDICHFTDQEKILITMILTISTSFKKLKIMLKEVTNIYSTENQLNKLATGIINFSIVFDRLNLPKDKLNLWLTAWEEQTRQYEELRLPVKLQGVAIKYFTNNKDEKVLLELPSEERKILQQALGLEEN